ncbi:MAG: TIGR01777 family oxidoreductase [Myxococcota bacterium]
MSEFRRTLDLDHPVEALASWHARPGAFQRLAPPWETMEVVRQVGDITDGSILEFKVKQGPVALTWEAHHEGYEPGRQFIDVQKRGPFASWAHTHRFEPRGEEASTLDDHIHYKLPLSPVSDLVAGWFVRKMLDRMFTFRHRRTMNDLDRHALFADRPRQTVAITGASGLIGTDLSAFLTTGGHTVKRLVRRDAAGDEEISWKPSAQKIDAASLEGMDAVVHLAGAGVADKPWTESYKRTILESRTKGTTLLAETLANLERKPRVFISASAIGYYGDRGGELLTEEEPAGDGFLAEVCEAWEASTKAASDAGIRVVRLRIGLVCSAKGGLIHRLLLPFKMGVGGRLGDGHQYMSWVSLDDVVGAIHHAMWTEELEGPVNVTAPTPVTNREFTRAFGAAVGRPTFIPVPRFGLRAVFGEEMTSQVFFSSQRVQPKRLEDTGFGFTFTSLEEALRYTLGT